MKLKLSSVFFALMFLASGLRALGTPVKEVAISDMGTVTSLSVATGTWTLATTTTTAMAGRSGLIVSNPATNSNIRWVCHKTTPTEAVSVGFLFFAGITDNIPCGNDVNVYLVSTSTTGAQSVITGEPKQ